MLEAFHEIENEIKKVYLVADEGIFKLLAAAMVSLRIPGPAVFLFIVGPPGGGKTEFLSMFRTCLNTHTISSLTPTTLISGMKKQGQETSLLMKIGKLGQIIMKDFTTILSMHRDARGEILGQLREVYDGYFEKIFGTGERIAWQGKIGLIAGVTGVIYNAQAMYAAMGERFIMYYLKQPDRKAVAMVALNNVSKLKEAREHFQARMKDYVDNLFIPEELPDLPEEIKHDIIALADFACRARSTVERDYFSPNKDIIFVHEPEMPTRFVEQLAMIYRALMVMNGGVVLPEDRVIVYKLALDSISSTKRGLLQKLTQYEEVTTRNVATALDYPSATVQRWLEDLTALGLVARRVDGTSSNSPNYWSLKREWKDLMTRYEGIAQTTDRLIDLSVPPVGEEELDLESIVMAPLEEETPIVSQEILEFGE